MVKNRSGDDERTKLIAELRAERKKIKQRMLQDKEKVRELSAQLRDLEGKPDKSGRPQTRFRMTSSRA
jgi:hypothetical protein